MIFGSPTMAMRPPYAEHRVALRHGLGCVVGAFAVTSGLNNRSRRFTSGSENSTT